MSTFLLLEIGVHTAVVAVEADPTSARFHKKNFQNDKRVLSMHAAVVADEAEITTTMSIAPRGETWRNSLRRYSYYKKADGASRAGRHGLRPYAHFI